MFIYCITNSINGKVYIGQSIKPIQERFKRHIQDAMSNRLDTHLARAIRKYGPEAFSIKQIDKAETQEELTKKETYWIRKYDAVNSGYNETDSETKCGGNTYLSKTEEELKIIKAKIRATKLGGNNPHSTKVKCKNVKTGEEYHFDSQSLMREFFGASDHQFISRRCNRSIRCLYKGEWAIAYEDDEYDANATQHKHNRKATHCLITNKITGETKEFPSYAAAERYFGLKLKYFSGRAYLKDEEFDKGDYHVKVLN